MKSKLLLGLLLIVVGLLVALQEFGVIAYLGIDAGVLFSILFLLLGISLIIKSRSIIFGGIVVLISSVSLLKIFFDLDMAGKIIFPGILVIIGLELMFGNFFKRKGIKSGVLSDENTVNAFATFSGVEKKVVSQDFKGGSVVAALGGVELDLTEIKLQSDAVLELNAFMGGIEIKLPSNIRVRSDINGFMGGVDLKYRQAIDASGPILVLKGTAFMGAIEIY